MTENTPSRYNPFEQADEISDYGERVSHLVKDFTFYGHLSIYEFAKRFCRDAVVLDAGSGAGYGSAALAEAGARRVYGVDASAKAVAFSKHHFRQPNLEFDACSLEELAFPPSTLDFVFTSNTLEHVADIPRFLRAAHRSMKPTGTMLVAVPPITDERLVYLNVINRYHLNIWSPRQWHAVLGEFFGRVDPFVHLISDRAAQHLTAPATGSDGLSADDFMIRAATLEEFYKSPTLTAIFVAAAPRTNDALPDASKPLAFMDDSFSRPLGYIPPEVERRLKPFFDADARPVGADSSPAAADEPTPDEPNIARRAWFVWRTAGTRALLRKTIDVLGRKR
jgi:2-polyprenyl-3-methyl-5-hydroxy-6-metoxy-1,4-benzoquinol methylase